MGGGANRRVMDRHVLRGPSLSFLARLPHRWFVMYYGAQCLVGSKTSLFGATAPSMVRNVLWGPKLSFLARLPHRCVATYCGGQDFPFWRDCPIDGSRCTMWPKSFLFGETAPSMGRDVSRDCPIDGSQRIMGDLAVVRNVS